jgi:hypothetical protein
MSVKRVIDIFKSVVDGDMSADVVSPSTNILYTDRVGFQISYTGSPTGVFSVQVSNDESIWQDLTLSVAIEAAGSADNHYIDAETSARHIRLKYTRESGSGTLQVSLVAKSISG